MPIVIEISFPRDDEEDDTPAIEPSAHDGETCALCTRTIGEEVGYGDNWGQGPICAECADL